jgi:hypothetical protein
MHVARTHDKAVTSLAGCTGHAESTKGPLPPTNRIRDKAMQARRLVVEVLDRVNKVYTFGKTTEQQAI